MAILAALDPEFEHRTRESFARQTAMATLGIELERVAPGEIDMTLAHRPDLVQQHGFIHAGIVSTALDSACGYAAYTLMPADAAVLTIEFKVNLLAPARGPVLRIEGRVFKPGRTITVCEGRAVQDGDNGETVVATMTATMMTLVGRAIAG